MKLRKLVASVLATALVGATVMVAPISASADEVPTSYKATLSGQLVKTEYWNSNAGSTTVDHDGTYDVSITYSGDDGQVTADDLCLILELDFNLYSLVPKGSNPDLEASGITMGINSVTVDGVSLNYSGSPTSNAYRCSDDGKSIRFNIYNTWSDGTGQHTTDITVPFDVKNGSVVSVNFTVNGLENAIAKAQELNASTTSNTDNSQVTTTEGDTSSDDTTTTTTVADGSTTTTTANGSTTTTANGTTTAGANNSSNNSSNGTTTTKSGDSPETATEDTATATGDTGVAGIVLVVALAGLTGAAMRKKH